MYISECVCSWHPTPKKGVSTGFLKCVTPSSTALPHLIAGSASAKMSIDCTALPIISQKPHKSTRLTSETGTCGNANLTFLVPGNLLHPKRPCPSPAQENGAGLWSLPRLGSVWKGFCGRKSQRMRNESTRNQPVGYIYIYIRKLWI